MNLPIMKLRIRKKDFSEMDTHIEFCQHKCWQKFTLYTSEKEHFQNCPVRKYISNKERFKSCHF